MNRNYFLLGGVLSLLIPVLNGAVTGDWLWETWKTLPAVFGVNIFWLGTGCAALWKTTQISAAEEETDEKGISETKDSKKAVS